MQLDPYETEQLLQNTPNLVILDVREAWKYDTLPRLKAAHHLYVGDVASQIDTLVPDKDTPILLYCTIGVKSHHALRTLQTLGYTQVHDGGGIDTWFGLLDPWLA